MDFSRQDIWRAAIAGEAIAILSLPILKNIKFFELLMAHGGTYEQFLFFWLIILPAISAFGLYLAHCLIGFWGPIIFELAKYGIVGWLNTFLQAGTFNLLILMMGIAVGWWIDVFAVVSFAIAITNGFFWNKFWTFGAGNTKMGNKEYAKYVFVTGATSLLGLLLLHIIINTIGAPQGIDEKVWANIALAILMPVSFLGNFFGSKIFVFIR